MDNIQKIILKKHLQKLNDDILKDKTYYKFLWILFIIISTTSVSYASSTFKTDDDVFAVLTSSICFSLANTQTAVLNSKKEQKKFLNNILKELEENKEEVKVKKLDIKV